MTPARLTAMVAASLLAACSGGGLPNGSVVNSPGGGGPTQPPTNLVNVKVTVTIPSRSKQHKIRRNYVSVNTESLVIELSSVDGQGVTGVNPTTIETLQHARGCKVIAQQTVCTGTASGSPGKDVFAVTTYAGTNATGPVLSVGTVQAKIGPGGGGVPISNRLSLALDGVIASLKLAVSPNGAKRGEPAKAAVSLVPYDASGAQIVGPSDFAVPIALAIEGDSEKAFLLHAAGKSAESLTIVRPTSQISLTYDGNKQASTVTLAATVDGPGSIGADANFALHGKIPPPPVGTIYALNFGTNDGRAATVTEYDGKAKGNAQPERSLQLSSKLYARSIAVDSSGDLYVGYFDNEQGFSASNGAPDKGNEVAIYSPDASGNATPSAVLTADKNTQTALFPLFMSFDPSGDLVTYGATGIDGIGGNDAMLTYSPESSGPAAPIDGWAFASPTIHYAGPTGLALDSAGNFYLNGALHSALGPSYGLFVALASDNGNPAVTPSRTVPWDGTTELEPGLTSNVGISNSGEIFIANTEVEGSGSSTACQGRANVYASGSTGGTTDVPPLRVLVLGSVFTTNPQCDSPRNPLAAYFPSLTLYGSTLFVVDVFNNAIDAFSASGHGNVKPSLTIAGSATGLSSPVALVITSISGQAKARPVRPL